MSERGSPDNFDSGTQSTLFIFRVEIDGDNPLHPENDLRSLSLSLGRARHLGYLKSREKIKSRREVRGHSSASSLLELGQDGFWKIF